MKPIPLHQLAAMVQADNADDVKSTTIPCLRVCTDSRAVQPGDCFFAVKGERFDGHDFVDQALDKGAVCAVVNRSYPIQGNKALLRVTDTIQALGECARIYRQRGDYTVIGITGSVGKTSTRMILAHVLSRHFRVHQSPRNFNNSIGLPLTLLGADQDHNVIVAELGSSALGEIGLLTRIARPDIAVVTNVHEAHLQGFGTIETIAQEKLSIAEGLTDQGVLILNADCAPLMQAAQRLARPAVTFGLSDSYHPPSLVSYGVTSQTTIQGSNVTYHPDSSRITVDGTTLTITLPGPGNVSNTLAAWAAAQRMGLSMEDFNHALQTLPAIEMRGQLMRLGELTLICDYYNASPASMKNALAIMQAQSGARQRRVLILGDMAELGAHAEILHEDLGRDIAETGVDLIVAVGPMATLAAHRARAESNNQLQIHCFTDTMLACRELPSLIQSGDLIVIKGSRSVRLEQAVETLKADHGKVSSTVG